MHALFNPDSKFMRAMSRVGDLMLLNLYFILTSIPLITIGASLTALFSVCFKFGTDRESGTSKAYFQAFRENFRQATCLWLILLGLLICSGVNTLFFFVQPGWTHYLSVLFLILFVVLLIGSCYTCALQSQFENTVISTLKNALILSIAWLPRSILIAVLAGFPLYLLFKDLYVFLQSGFIFILIYFSAAAYLSTILLKKVFKPFLEEDNEDTTEEETR